MKALFFVLNRIEKLNPLLNEFANIGVRGATILNSNGMAHALFDSDDHNVFASFRHYLDPKRKESKTIVMIINEDEQEKIVNTIEEIVGDIDNADTGIIFTVPVDFVRGMTR